MITFWIIILGSLGFFFGNANPIFHFAPLALLYPASLYYFALNSKNPYRNAIICALLGGSIAFYWVAIAVYLYGNFPLFLAIPCTMMGGLSIALWAAVFVYIIRLFSHGKPLLRCFVAFFAWTVLEYFRGFMFTGFPWFTLASAFASHPVMIQSVSIIGNYSLSGLFATSACFFVETIHFISNKKLNYHHYPTKFNTVLTLSGGFILIIVIYLFGMTRIKMSYNDDFFKNLKSQPYISLSEIIPSPDITLNLGVIPNSEAVPSTDTMPSTVNRPSKENNFNDTTILAPNKNYHHDPALIGPSIHTLTLPYSKTGRTINLDDNRLGIFTLVQGNVSQAIKWDPTFQEATLEKYIRLSKLGQKFVRDILDKSSILVWPETAIPFYFQDLSPLSERLLAFTSNQQLFFGAPAIDPYNGNIYNRLFFFDFKNKTKDAIFFYDKEHLVPFGEYFPDLPLPKVFEELMGDFGGFSKGVNNELITIVKNKQNYKTGVLICYEAIFPEIAREQIKKGANLFINVSNDAWYDISSAAKQHLDLSILRAVEQNRFLIRTGNTGITAFVDPYGRVMASTKIFTDETLSGIIQYRYDKTIFYYIAPFIFPSTSIILLIFIIIAYRQRKKISPIFAVNIPNSPKYKHSSEFTISAPKTK